MEFSLINVLAITASILILGVTGGIAYLTTLEWRDRRRQEREKRQQR